MASEADDGGRCGDIVIIDGCGDVVLQWGPYSEALQTLTGAGVPHAPSTPDIYFKSPTVAVIGWQEPVTNGAPIIEYHMEWTCREDQDFVQVTASLLLSVSDDIC